MTEQDKKELLQIAEVAFKAYALTLELSSPKEQQFIIDNRDIFLCIFNKIVLATKRLLDNEKLNL